MINGNDYYSSLGVTKNASPEEIRQAYKSEAKRNHPDKLVKLPEDEKSQRIKKMYELNEAYGILSDPEKRQEYDRLSISQSQPRNTEGRTTNRTRNTMASYDLFFQQLFSQGGIFGDSDNFGQFGNLFGNTARKHDDYIMIPETDWGLLIALKKAYISQSDGKWRVKRTEDDQRNWMPNHVYSIIKKGNNVSVFRTITDWRSEWKREQDIEVRQKGSSYLVEERFKPNRLLGEYYLYGDGRDRLSDRFDIPTDYGKYIGAIKSLAQKLVTNEHHEADCVITDELKVMNLFGKYGSKNTRKEGDLYGLDDQDKEWVRKTPLADFWKKINRAEGTVVQIEGMPISKEGSSFTGESKG